MKPRPTPVPLSATIPGNPPANQSDEIPRPAIELPDPFPGLFRSNSAPRPTVQPDAATSLDFASRMSVPKALLQSPAVW